MQRRLVQSGKKLFGDIVRSMRAAATASVFNLPVFASGTRAAIPSVLMAISPDATV